MADQPSGLTFRELLAAVRERQGHDVHRGTLRAVLYAGGFVCREGRWRAGVDEGRSRRLLREAIVLAAGEGALRGAQGLSARSRLLEVAMSVADRCRALQQEFRRTKGESKPGKE